MFWRDSNTLRFQSIFDKVVEQIAINGHQSIHVETHPEIRIERVEEKMQMRYRYRSEDGLSWLNVDGINITWGTNGPDTFQRLPSNHVYLGDMVDNKMCQVTETSEQIFTYSPFYPDGFIGKEANGPFIISVISKEEIKMNTVRETKALYYDKSVKFSMAAYESMVFLLTKEFGDGQIQKYSLRLFNCSKLSKQKPVF